MQSQDNQIGQNLKKDIESFTDFKQETIERTYDDVADKYDDIMKGMGHPDPRSCAELAAKGTENIEGPLVLDLGCGTGLVGEELLKLNFKKEQIWGVDASQGMLDVAETKQAYSKLIQLFLGKPDTYPEELRNKFDVVIAAGVLAEGHLGIELFDEFLLSLKTGGYAIFTTREEYLTKYGYGPAIQSHVEAGRMKPVEKKEFERYHKIEEGETIGRFKTVKALALVYQKL